MKLDLKSRKKEKIFIGNKDNFFKNLVCNFLDISQYIAAVVVAIAKALYRMTFLIAIAAIKTYNWICRAVGSVVLHPNLFEQFGLFISSLILVVIGAYLADTFQVVRELNLLLFVTQINFSYLVFILLIGFLLLIIKSDINLGGLEWMRSDEIKHFPKSEWLGASPIKFFQSLISFNNGLIGGTILICLVRIFVY